MSFIIETYRQVYSTTHGETWQWKPFKVDGKVPSWATRREAEMNAELFFTTVKTRVVDLNP